MEIERRERCQKAGGACWEGYMAFRNGIDVNPYRFGPFLRGQDNTEYSNHLEWYKVDYRPVATGETFGELSEPRN